MKQKRPFADTRLAKFIDKRVLELRPKSQTDIAIEAGFTRPNVLSMIRHGACRLPLDRVPGLAKALDTDPAKLFALALEQRGPDTTAAAIREIFHTVVSANEAEWLSELRKASGNTDPRLTTRARSAIRAIFGN